MDRKRHYTKTWVRMSVVVLVAIRDCQTRNDSNNHPRGKDELNGGICIHLVECYTAKKNEMLMFYEQHG